MSGARQKVLITTDAVGGVWTYSVDLARGLAPLGFETILAVLGPAPSAAQRQAARAVPGLRLVETGAPLDWLAEDAEAVAAAGAVVAALAREHRVDLVQLHAPALAAGITFGVPVVAVVHSCVATWWAAVEGDAPLPDDFAWRTAAVRAGLAAAHAVVTPTAAFGAMVQRAYDLPAAPHVVHNGRSRAGLTAQAPHDYLFTSGRLWDRGKNVAALDAAAATISVPVHAAGPVEAPHGDRIVLRHVNALGTLAEAELDRWLAARPVFVSAARYEPFGLSVLEAAAAGCPLILSDIPTFRELWDEAAVFVDPDDVEGLARACNTLVGDDFERAVLGRAARTRAARFTPEAMAAQMARHYRDLLPTLRRPVLAARAA